MYWFIVHLFLLANKIMFVFLLGMQITNFGFNNFNQQPMFGTRVSALGKQIDKVVFNKGKDCHNVTKLYGMLFDYIRNPNIKSKMLGEGFHEKVFSIDDKYVLKYKQNQRPVLGTFSFNPREVGIDLGDLKSYFGKILMRFGDVKILRNVSSNGEHIPAGIPRMMFGKFPKEKLIDYYNKEYLPTFARLPQRSFDRIAKDFACLNSKSKYYYGLEFDTHNPNNIVLVGKSTLRIVDDINEVIDEEPNTVSGLLDIFLKRANTCMLAPKTEENRSLRLELFKKVILAGEKYELPLSSGNIYDNTVWDMVCDFGKSGDEIRWRLNELRENFPNIKERLNMVQKELGLLEG